LRFPGGIGAGMDLDDSEGDIGEAIGIIYRDGEELRFGRKEAERDEHRWELDPASSDDWLQRTHDRSAGPAEELRHLSHRHRQRRPV
jgi:hypothetical protein